VINLYEYVDGNPLRYIDKTGLEGSAPPDAGSKSEADFRESHVYSAAPNAAAKFEIDRKILGGDFSKGELVDMDSEDYLKKLVGAAGGTVKTRARGLQFFIIEGGGEGFLPERYKGVDASDEKRGDISGTNNAADRVMWLESNNLIVAFDAHGKLVSSAREVRPLEIKDPDPKSSWSRGTSDAVFSAWDNRPVSVYRNKRWEINYFGLRVDDSRGFYRTHPKVDMHKTEATNGCHFIVDGRDDENTPSTSDPKALSAFEPKFIQDVMAAAGVKNKKDNIGTMHILTIGPVK
jgi:hypothetical protein